MTKTLWIFLSWALLLLPAAAQELSGRTIEIKGDGRPAEAARLSAIWLYPEDYEGKSIKLHGFLLEAENFEYFPEQNGYLFSCEPVIYGRNNAFHAHVGNATFLSQEKLNFLCSTADGQWIRRLFKQHPDEWAITVDITLKVEKREGKYFGTVTSFKPKNVTE
jgi:hypothetical protein